MAPWSKHRALPGLAIFLALGSCTFNTSNLATADDGGPLDGGGDDSGSTIGGRPDAIAPSDCPEDIHIEITVGGQTEPISSGEPFVHTLIGDTVELSAVGTCTQSGVINYRWVIEPGTSQAEDTALPNLNSEIITVFSHKPENYTVRLEVDDGNQTQSQSVFAFAAHGFESIPTYVGGNIKTLSAGADYLWVGADDAAYRGELIAPQNPYPLVNDLYAGDSLSVKMRTHESGDGVYAWFGSDDPEGKAYRLDLQAGSITTIDTTIGAKTKEIRDGATGVRYATDRGVVFAADSESFVVERIDFSEAVSSGLTGDWAARNELFPLPMGAPIDVFVENDEIKCLGDDGTLLWAGGRKGVATLLAGVVQNIYTEADSDLVSNDVKDMSVDAATDIWVAANGGVSRFKQDRQIWVPMPGDSGLGAELNQAAIDVDESPGRRAVYVGGTGGLFVMRVP